MSQKIDLPIYRHGRKVPLYEIPVAAGGWEWVTHSNWGTSNGCDGSCRDAEEHIHSTCATLEKTYPSTYGPNSVGGPPGFHFGPKTIADLRQLLKDSGDPPQSYAPVARAAPKSGVICKRCGMKNEYGAPNQKDNSYVCYMCR